MRKFICFIFLIGFVSARAQQSNIDYSIEYISTKEGLTHNYVSQVVSDSLNIKWIAQENGITKYDGENFTRIEPGEKYPGLKNENIETLFIDSTNKLWIGTKSGGLSMLDIKTNVLVNYDDILLNGLKKTLRILAITEDAIGNIWIGSTRNGIFVLNPRTNILVNHYPELGRIHSLLTDSKGNIWMADYSVLKKYDPSEDRFFKFRLGNRIIYDIIEDTLRNCLWIATSHPKNNKNKEVFKFDFNSQKIESVTTNITHNLFTSLYLDDANCLWIGTWGSGLYKSNKDVSAFKKIKLTNINSSKKEINYINVLDIHRDNNGVMWISTTFGGVVKLIESKGFKNIDLIVENPILRNELNFQSISSDKNNVWLGTQRKGLFKGKNLASLKKVTAIKNSKIYAIHNHEELFFVGANAIIYILDTNGKEIARIQNVRKSTCFLVDNKNRLLVGTQQDGIFIYDISRIEKPTLIENYRINEKENQLESNRITSIVKDAHDKLWVGTYNGVHLLDPKNNTIIHQKELLDEVIPKIINTIYLDASHIWVGTPNGLYKFKNSKNKLSIVEKYDEEHGLKNDFICGITKDKDNNLWVATSTTIARLDIDNNSFINYGANDGVHTSQFNVRSVHQSDSLILFGGSDNLTYFNPSAIKSSESSYEVVMTQLKINNNVVLPGDTINGNVIIKKDINYVDAIVLSHNDKSFDLSFVNSNYRNDISTNFRYKLDGYQNDWVYIQNKNEVNFIGLPPGSYEFQLSASEDFKNWSIPKSLGIKILYAPWSSPMAYFIYLVFFLGIVGSVVYLFMKQLNERNKLKKEQELSEAKFTFFTNISHEFRTPLTLILSPLKELNQSDEFVGKTAEKLITMEKNAHRLLNLINQLLDFRKAGHGLLKLNVNPGNFVRFSNEIFLYFKEQAITKQINYKFESDKDEILFPFDRNKMEIVLCNLISNSFKYSPPGSEVTLKISASEDTCILVLTDTGYGMNKESKKKIFDRFYQINSTNTTNIIGSGIGLSFTKKIVELHHGTIAVHSKLNKGTTFTIEIPLNQGEQQIYGVTSSSTVHTTQKVVGNMEMMKPEIKNLKVVTKENTVLVVDDNEEIRDYLTELLCDEYNIIGAKDGMEAVALASNEIPDLVLCDIMMPKKDGLAVCKELKEQITTSHIPIILLTARSSNLFEIKGLELGADDFITKPFDPKIVKARISSALQNRTKLREHFLNKIRFEPTVSKGENKDQETIFIEKVVQLVEENLMNEAFGIESLKSQLFMSQSTLYRKIKSLTGLSLTGFIRSIRLKKAAEIILLKNEKLNVVALQVGFNDYKYFGESFKKQFGCLPSEYKSMKK